MASNNSLIVTDYGSNLERIAQLIEDLDAPAKADFISITIKHASASDVATLVARLLDASEVGANDVRLKVSLVPEPRSNALLVRSSSPARIEQVRQLIEQVDATIGEAWQHSRGVFKKRRSHPTCPNPTWHFKR
jgi:general secretion pathway protein D